MRCRSGTTRTWTLRAAGSVALGAAAHQLATGLGGVRGLEPEQVSAVTPNLDSEMRFYAAWYATAGVLMHQAATNGRVDRQIAPVLTGGWSLAAFSRLLSMRAVGRPDPFFLVLTALELGVAGVLAATRPRRRELVAPGSEAEDADWRPRPGSSY